ncbi:hypothetical protein D3C80_1228010 [compost metagenome]
MRHPAQADRQGRASPQGRLLRLVQPQLPARRRRLRARRQGGAQAQGTLPADVPGDRHHHGVDVHQDPHHLPSRGRPGRAVHPGADPGRLQRRAYLRGGSPDARVPARGGGRRGQLGVHRQRLQLRRSRAEFGHGVHQPQAVERAQRAGTGCVRAGAACPAALLRLPRCAGVRLRPAGGDGTGQRHRLQCVHPGPCRRRPPGADRGARPVPPAGRAESQAGRGARQRIA